MPHIYTDFDFNNKDILITGGAGFIGSNLAHYFEANYPASRVTVFDVFQSKDKFDNGNFIGLGHYKNLLNFRGKVISGDITKEHDTEVLKSVKWDCIFHQAAVSDTTVLDQSFVIKTNTNTLNFFIELALKSNAHLVYASSAGTYGNTPSPNRVGAGEIPENVYGFSKLMMDNIALSTINSNPELKITALRYFNVYGNREFYKGKTASMILQLGLQILAGRKPKLFKYGEQSRDFVFVEDVVQANIRAISKASGIYNVGSGLSRTFNDIINILKKELGCQVDIEYIDNPYSFYQNNTCADIESTRIVLGYNPQYSLEDGIARYVPEILNIHAQLNG